VLTTVGCGIPPIMADMPPVGFAGYGALRLTNGRYDEHIDLPLPPGTTGSFFSDLHIHQPGH
jgi:hypothetical protein